MKFKRGTCPTCKKPARQMMERVIAWADLDRTTDGFDYAGNSDVDWDSQRPDEQDGKVTLCCGQHTWQTTFLLNLEGNGA